MEENSWRGLVLAWANRLQLTNQPAQQMIDFTDGKFFAAFIIKHLPFWKTKGQTKTETFAELEAGFQEEFTACSVVNMAGAMEGHEDVGEDVDPPHVPRRGQTPQSGALFLIAGKSAHMSDDMKLEISLATGWVHQRSTAAVEMRSAGQLAVLV